jgi:hypothetical protein
MIEGGFGGMRGGITGVIYPPWVRGSVPGAPLDPYGPLRIRGVMGSSPKARGVIKVAFAANDGYADGRLEKVTHYADVRARQE